MRITQRFANIVSLIALQGLAGCANLGNSAALPRDLTPNSDVKFTKAWKDAELIAQNNENAFVLIGTGRSMLPLYGEHTILVIKRMDYAELTPGMMVAFLDESGFRVVHQLVGKRPEGWRTQGMNNEALDPEPLTSEKYLGIVYANFSSKDEPIISPQDKESLTKN